MILPSFTLMTPKLPTMSYYDALRFKSSLLIFLSALSFPSTKLSTSVVFLDQELEHYWWGFPLINLSTTRCIGLPVTFNISLKVCFELTNSHLCPLIECNREEMLTYTRNMHTPKYYTNRDMKFFETPLNNTAGIFSIRY